MSAILPMKKRCPLPKEGLTTRNLNAFAAVKVVRRMRAEGKYRADMVWQPVAGRNSNKFRSKCEEVGAGQKNQVKFSRVGRRIQRLFSQEELILELPAQESNVCGCVGIANDLANVSYVAGFGPATAPVWPAASDTRDGLPLGRPRALCPVAGGDLSALASSVLMAVLCDDADLSGRRLLGMFSAAAHRCA